MSKSTTIQVTVVISGKEYDRSYHRGAKISKDQADHAVSLAEAAVIETLEKLVGAHKPKV